MAAHVTLHENIIIFHTILVWYFTILLSALIIVQMIFQKLLSRLLLAVIHNLLVFCSFWSTAVDRGS